MNKLRLGLWPGLFCLLTACAGPNFGLAPIPEKEQPSVSSRTIQVAHSFSSSDALTATEYTFDYPLQHMQFGLPQDQILMVGTNKANRLQEKPVFLFNPNSGEIAWRIKTLAPNFNIVANGSLPERVIMLGKGNEIFAVDYETGQTAWQRPGNNVTVGFFKNLAFSKRSVEGGIQLEVFDALNGETLWTRDRFNCNTWGYNTLHPDENSVLFYGDGLHLLNLKTGEGWDYDVDTNAIGGIGKMVAGEALSLLAAMAGSVHVNTVRTDRLENLTSNAMIIKDRIYYAGNTVLVCIDLKSGEELWKTELPQKAGHSGLFEEDGHLLLIGYGWCHKNKVTTNYAEPFVARYDKEDGSQLLYQTLGLNDYVRSCSIQPEGYLLVSEGQVLFVDKNNPANARAPKELDKEKSSLYSKASNLILNPQDYFVLKEDGGEKRLIGLASLKTGESDFWVRTLNGIVHYDNRFEVQNWFPETLLHYKVHTLDNVVLVRLFNQKCGDKNKGYCKSKENILMVQQDDGGQLLGEIKTEFAEKIIGESLMFWDNTKMTATVTVLPLDNLDHFIPRPPEGIVIPK